MGIAASSCAVHVHVLVTDVHLAVMVLALIGTGTGSETILGDATVPALICDTKINKSNKYHL